MNDDEEFKLAQHMKENYCDDSGKEINAENAAETLHKIALIYKKKDPDKISLIKSAGLLNAAIVRNPSNVSQIKFDLSDLCRHILRQANAKKQNVDLIQKAEEVKASVNKLRNEVSEYLATKARHIPNHAEGKFARELKSKKVAAIRHINREVAYKYKQIMSGLSQFCEDIMGTPPCEYAIVGMGSLAREEITPYSDFEHIILLFDEKNYTSYLEYFRWFSVIFHIIVLNVQETLVASLNICCLNDKNSSLGDWFYDAITPRGISFDGMMPHACKFPLGRQQHTKIKQFTTELIKPVSEMLQYLSSEADLKNGYHLADILTKTCFVFGNEDIFKQFVDGAQIYRDTKSAANTKKDIQQQVEEDLNNFSTRFRLTNLKSQNTINIKQFVYRSSTIFISALARKHNIPSNTCFGVIDELEKNDHFTYNTADKLRYAIAIACEMRLRVYTAKKSQCDNAIDLTQDGMQKFLDIVGLASTINYFQITYCLQCEVAKQLNFTKLHFYSNPELINITIGLTFGINMTKFSDNPPPLTYRYWDSSKFDFDTCIEQLEANTELPIQCELTKVLGQKKSKTLSRILNRNVAHCSQQSKLNANQILHIASFLKTANIFDEAVDFFKQLRDIYQCQPKSIERDQNVAWTNYKIACCLNKLNKTTEALSYFKQTLEIQERIPPSGKSFFSQEFSTVPSNVKFWKKIPVVSETSEFREFLQNPVLSDLSDVFGLLRYAGIAEILEEISHCQTQLKKYDEAIKTLNQILEIIPRSKLAQMPNYLTNIHIKIGQCWRKLHKYANALTHLHNALEIEQTRTPNACMKRRVANIFQEIGCCHYRQRNFHQALASFRQALEIKQKITLDADKDKSIAFTLHFTGACYLSLFKYNKALAYLNGALQITLSAKSDDDNLGGNFDRLLHRIAFCQTSAARKRRNIERKRKLCKQSFKPIKQHRHKLREQKYEMAKRKHKLRKSLKSTLRKNAKTKFKRASHDKHHYNGGQALRSSKKRHFMSSEVLYCALLGVISIIISFWMS